MEGVRRRADPGVRYSPTEVPATLAAQRGAAAGARSAPISPLNPDNPSRHQHRQSAQIRRQTSGEITHFAAAMGTNTGTITVFLNYPPEEREYRDRRRAADRWFQHCWHPQWPEAYRLLRFLNACNDRTPKFRMTPRKMARRMAAEEALCGISSGALTIAHGWRKVRTHLWEVHRDRGEWVSSTRVLADPRGTPRLQPKSPTKSRVNARQGHRIKDLPIRSRASAVSDDWRSHYVPNVAGRPGAGDQKVKSTT